MLPDSHPGECVLRGGREDAAQRQNLSEARPLPANLRLASRGRQCCGKVKDGGAGGGRERQRQTQRKRERRLQRQREYISLLGLP